ncbi:sensor histidine kinase [Streptacidiphilus cavernicola]|uniref:histidine kinase n=1 Tax=Streptacidiphilus cavernicola TaxID=3342716 RepID=A0ABV6VQX4_9ACTN
MQPPPVHEPGIPDRLRSIELFDELTDEQHAWLTGVTGLRRLEDGEILFEDGAEATHFYVLSDGELIVTKLIDGRNEVLTRHSSHPTAADQHDDKPSVAHRFTGELPLLTDGGYVATATAVGPTTVLVYTKDAFLDILVRCAGVARMLLPVLAWRIKASEMQARNRATTMALGTLAAGLAHELNNPAAAMARVAQDLVPAVERLDRSAQRWGSTADAADREALAAAVRAAAEAPVPTVTDPVSAADAEDDLLGWAEERGCSRAAVLASALADQGLTTDWLDERLDGIRPESLAAALDHLSSLLETRVLTGELRAAAPRISTLVAATRDYANLDRAPEQTFAVTDGLEATLTMLRPKLAQVRVVRDYAPGLPPMTGYPTELNQVWTNLIDNAVDAMEGAGTLTLRVAREGACLTVEIGDTGTGIPADSLPRIFEPFYTTKDVGKGTGLGLHLSHRIVHQRHHGSITARSAPGDTRILVRVPLDGGGRRLDRTPGTAP